MTESNYHARHLIFTSESIDKLTKEESVIGSEVICTIFQMNWAHLLKFGFVEVEFWDFTPTVNGSF